MIDYYVRHVALPRKVEGVSIPNDDGSFDIYITSLLPPEQRSRVLEHELRHIRHEHFYLDMDLRRMERQADGEALNVVLHPPAGMVPCFQSETALAHWVDTLCAQLGVEL